MSSLFHSILRLWITWQLLRASAAAGVPFSLLDCVAHVVFLSRFLCSCYSRAATDSHDQGPAQEMRPPCTVHRLRLSCSARRDANACAVFSCRCCCSWPRLHFLSFPLIPSSSFPGSTVYLLHTRTLASPPPTLLPVLLLLLLLLFVLLRRCL